MKIVVMVDIWDVEDVVIIIISGEILDRNFVNCVGMIIRKCCFFLEIVILCLMGFVLRLNSKNIIVFFD